MSKPYRAIFFDLDGTLLPMDQDAFVKRYFGLLSQYFAAEGFDPKAVFAAVLDGTHAMIRNDGSRTNEDLFWDVFCKSASLKKDDVYRRFNAFYDTQFDFSRDATGENPEARDAVAAAHSAADLVVLSTNPLFPPAAIRARLSWIGLAPSDFDFITTYDNSSSCKPNPLYFSQLLSRFDLAPQDVLLVGNDVQEDACAAKAVGIRTYLVTDCLLTHDLPYDEFSHGSFSDMVRMLKSL